MGTMGASTVLIWKQSSGVRPGVVGKSVGFSTYILPRAQSSDLLSLHSPADALPRLIPKKPSMPGLLPQVYFCLHLFLKPDIQLPTHRHPLDFWLALRLDLLCPVLPHLGEGHLWPSDCSGQILPSLHGPSVLSRLGNAPRI